MTDYLVLLERGEHGWGAWSPDLNVYATAATRELVEQQGARGDRIPPRGPPQDQG